MFSSLRSRLWLSYAIVILGVLFLTAVVLVVYLFRSPLVYRSTLLELQAARKVLLSSQPDLASLSDQFLTETLKTYDQALNVRILVVDSNRRVLLDSRAGVASAIKPPRRYQLLRLTTGLRDENGQYWLFVSEPLSGGRTLIFLIQRPKVPLLSILRNDLFLPFFYAGLVAMVLSLFVAFGLARWIGSPLQTLVSASRRMPETKPLAVQGPREVQELTYAFNEMSSRVQSAQKAQREFVANVSHELKTPLTSIQGFAQALQDGTADTPEMRRQAASVILQESERMHRMVLDLLDLERLDAGALELERTPVDISALLHSVAERFAPQARAAGVTIRVSAAALPPLTGDGDRLAQVFTNLVDNALKFTPSGGRITLQAAQTGSEVQIDVTDTGTGIPAEALPHIFDRFYQADPSRPGGGKHGAGLGLSIVKEIVAAHGGKISVRSEPGEGSTITISLPCNKPALSVIPRRKE
jgi:two-component system, OmpR family, sensor kinase